MKRMDFSKIVDLELDRHNIEIKRWRKDMSGAAWRDRFADGRFINWIEAPYPKTPISLSIFLHEIGHHAIGFATYRLRCEEEFHVWQWAFQKMNEYSVPLDERVKKRFERSMQYAVGKACRRRIKHLPEILVPFIPAA